MLAATLEYDQEVLTSELLNLLQAWRDTQDDVVLTRGLYDIGQTAFRHGIGLPELLRAVHRWVQPNDRVLAMPAAAFVTHFLTRGYEDAVR
jgi:hypothetical protein